MKIIAWHEDGGMSRMLGGKERTLDLLQCYVNQQRGPESFQNLL